jgi:ATP-dependent helicase HrpA
VDERIRRLEERIAACPAQERPSLLRRVRGLVPRAGRQSPPERAFEAVEREVERSAARRAAREASRPVPAYPEDLPVAQARDRVLAALASHQVVIVAGDTGSGKTTQLPKICIEAGRGLEGCITLTQPRRIAARSVAARIAEELGVQLGGPVGWKVRFDDRTDPGSVVRVVTDGVLLAEVERDPLFLRSDTIIVDEAHERSLNVDFLLGYLRRLLPRRPDLKVIVASATIDVDRFSEHFGGAPVVQVGGRLHPIEVRWRPDPDGEPGRPAVERVVRGIEECVAEGPGDVLAFLSGERDILDAADALARMPALAGCQVLPLHARLTAAEQERVFRTGPARRVILATNVAETSITVPGIRYVVDSGVARIARWSGRTRVLRLPVEPVSRASASQRAGRCGRVGPGICIRTWSEAEHAEREEFTPPELLRTDLASVVLRMKALGLGDVARFPFLDAPGPRAVAEGIETLAEIGAIDRGGALTGLGRRIAALPVDPRLARMVLAGAEEGALAETAVIAAALSVQDPRERPAAQAGLADLAHAALRDPESDFMSWLRLWRRWREESAARGPSALRRWCREHFLSHQRMREWAELHDQVRSMLEERLSIRVPPLAGSSDPARVHRSALAAFASQLGQRTDDGDYRTASGSRFAAFPGSALARRTPTWVVAAEVVETSRRFGRTLARVQGDWVELVAPHLVRRVLSEPHWVRATGQVAAWERVHFGELAIVPRRRVPYGPVDPAASRDIMIQAALVDGDCDLDAPFVRHNRALRERIEAMEAKRRERGLLADPQAVFAFFDARIPPQVHSLPALERWRRGAERRDPRVLFMEERDLLRAPADPALAARFPDRLDAGGGAAADLRYALEPGSALDGVHARLALDDLWTASAARLEWLVPGLLPDKVEALVRSLPKGLRTRFFPLRELAVAAAESMPFGEGDLRERLAAYLTSVGGAEVRPDAFDLGQLPPHLVLHLEVVDPDGAVLARGDDLAELRARLAPNRAGRRLDDLAAAFGGAWHRDGLRAFELDLLPERVEGRLPSGRTVVAHPALVDRFDRVDLRLLDHAAAAERATRAGLRTLFAIAARGAIRHHLEFAPGFDEACLHSAGIPGPAGGPSLADVLERCVAEAAFVDGLPAVRTPAEFEARLDGRADAVRSAAASAVAGARRIAGRAIDALEAVDGAVPGSWQASVSDIRSSVARLAAPSTLLRTPLARWPELVRWIEAQAVRARRLRSTGPERDGQAMAQVARWEDEMARAEAALASEGSDPEVLAPFRELIEEFRVSLFAQELRTRVPVSEERLARAWMQHAGRGSRGR